MAIKLKTTGEYRRAIIELRRFADGFEAHDEHGNETNFSASRLHDPYHNPLTKAERAKVRRYYDVLQRHGMAFKGARFQKFTTTDPDTGKRVTNKQKLAEAQKAMGMPTKQSWRGVFVPEASENTPSKLVKRRGKWLIEYRAQGVDTIFVPFDRMLFADLGVEYVRSLFAKAPKSYLYNLDMGYGRNRWKAGGNLDQMLRDLGFLTEGYAGHYAEFIMGVHVYRGGLKAYNEIKMENYRTIDEKRRVQEAAKKVIAAERRKLKKYQDEKAMARTFVLRGIMDKAQYEREFGESFD